MTPKLIIAWPGPPSHPTSPYPIHIGASGHTEGMGVGWGRGRQVIPDIVESLALFHCFLATLLERAQDVRGPILAPLVHVVPMLVQVRAGISPQLSKGTHSLFSRFLRVPPSACPWPLPARAPEWRDPHPGNGAILVPWSSFFVPVTVPS